MRDRREPLLTTADAVDYLRTLSPPVIVVPDTVRMWVRTGHLPVQRTVGGQCLFTRAALDRLIAARRDRERARG